MEIIKIGQISIEKRLSVSKKLVNIGYQLVKKKKQL